MEIYIGLAAVFAAFILSKENSRVPLVIAAYYVAYMITSFETLGFLATVFNPITLGKGAAAEWYLIQTAIDTLIVISLLAFCKRTLLVKFYSSIVALSALYNTFGLFFSALSMDWYSDIYLLHQRYAIQLDITIAWLASDNVISRNINGAFYGARNKGHEHGKPY